MPENSLTNSSTLKDSLHRFRFNDQLQKLKREALFKFISCALLYSAIAITTRICLYPLLSEQNILYSQLLELGAMGYFAIRIIDEFVKKLLKGHYHTDSQARSASTIIRIGGLLIILALSAVMLVKDPYVTLAITTFSGIAFWISMQSVIGNAISGLVLAIVRPFRIGDMITVFGITGSVKDVGLLYVRLTTVDGDEPVLIPNGTMLGTAIIRKKLPKKYDHNNNLR